MPAVQSSREAAAMKLDIRHATKEITRFWGRFSASERHQLIGACCFVIALFYGLLIWYPGNKKLDTLLYQEQKQKQREKASNPGALPSRLEGVNFQEIQKELAQARETLAGQEEKLGRLNARFAPLNDLESMQSLRSEITRLAESGDMEIVALEHIYRRAEDKDRPPTLDLLKEAAQDSPYRRPLLRLRARASYRGLMQFLDGLRTLTFIVAPVSSSIQVRMDLAPQRDAPVLGPAGQRAAKQWLEVEIRLAV
jgi:hypothetical protein